VGKSTTAVNLGACLAQAGKQVLVIDLDPQGNASTGLGIDHASRKLSAYDVLTAGHSIKEAITPTSVEGLWAVASTIDLAGAEIELVTQFNRESRLARALDGVRDEFDFVLLDCPPSLGLLTVNALTAADELIVPIQCEYYALEGLGQLLKNVRLVQQNVNPDLRLTGIVMTMFDGRTKLAEQVVEEVRAYFGPRVYESIIPRSIRLAEAPGFGQPITSYDPTSRGARAYQALAGELLTRPASDGLNDQQLEEISQGRQIAVTPVATPEASPPPREPSPEPEGKRPEKRGVKRARSSSAEPDRGEAPEPSGAEPSIRPKRQGGVRKRSPSPVAAPQPEPEVEGPMESPPESPVEEIVAKDDEVDAAGPGEEEPRRRRRWPFGKGGQP
jgi:chromosome partitioning protein